MKNSTDNRIIRWIRLCIENGVDIRAGEEIGGYIPESADLFYNGSQPGMIPFTHVVSRQDIRDALRPEGAILEELTEEQSAAIELDRR